MQVVSIFIPGNVQPYERGKFVDPLEEELLRQGLGEVIEEGTHLATEGGRQVVRGCEIQVEVSDLNAAVGLMIRELTKAGAPPATELTAEKRGQRTRWRLGDFERAK